MECELFDEINLDGTIEKIIKEIDDMSKTLNEQAQEIIKIAEASGVQSNFFFLTTFKRYQVQLNSLSRIEQELKKEDSATVTKEYVKGRPNIMVHPLITEYNKTTDSANKTLAALIRVIRTFNMGDGEKETEDPLIKAINGGDDYAEGDGK